MINLVKILGQHLLFLMITMAIFWSMATPVFAISQDSGAAIFQANCAGCHPQGGNIIRRGKTLKTKALKRNNLDTIEAVISLVTQGKNNMPAYEARLSEPEIEAVSYYVLEQAAQNWRN